ncbi:MAG TPA: polysaccharide deacetylase family protein [Acidimicrobiia bacterium]|nr:polysaccharide deacetylase family protein [Acidimicrobiia bacterium]
MRSQVNEVARTAAKAVFATADLFLGTWPGPRILIYHQIGAGSGRQMDLMPEAFRRHVDWLQSQGRIVGLGDALSGADDHNANRSYVLTFDDGYADFFENAFPLLRIRGIPFTLYLTSGHIETGKPLHEGDRPLTWDMVREMVDSGLVTMGAHTHSHPDLRGLRIADVEREIEKSNELIEGRTGLAPRHFAYPKGYWDPQAETVVRRHYDTAVLGAGPPVTGETDPHRVHRVPVQKADRQFFFARKVQRGMRLEERARALVKSYEHPR